MSKKKRKRDSYRIPGGYPEIAHPDNQAAYQWQCCFVYDWFSNMLERVEGGDKKATHYARGELQTLFATLSENLLRLAEDKDDSVTKQWAGNLLVSLYKNIEKHDKKLSGTNAKYAEGKKKLGKVRTNVLLPKGIGAVVQSELKKGEDCRKPLLVLKACFSRELHEPTRVRLRDSNGKDQGQATVFRTLHKKEKQERFKQAAKKAGIPEDYWRTINLPPFSLKSEPEWWEFLWPLIKRNNPDLLGKLRSNASRTEANWSFSDGVSKRELKSRKLFWKDFQAQFRNHLKAVAKLRCIS